MNTNRISNYNNKNLRYVYMTSPISRNLNIPYSGAISDVVSFAGEEEAIPVENSIKLFEARQISGIHCPVCGVKMLSKKDFNKLVSDASNIKNTKQLYNLLEKEQEFIPLRHRRILNDSKRIPDFKELEIKDYVAALKDIAVYEKSRTAKIFHRAAIANASNVPKEFSEEYQKFLENIAQDNNFVAINEKINAFNMNTNIDKGVMRPLRMQELRDLIQAERHFTILDIENIEELDNSQVAQILVGNIFRNSKNYMQKIEKYEYHLNHPYNKILACGVCDSRYKPERNVFFRDKNQQDLKHNIRQYLKDISLLNGTNVIDIPDNYLSYVCNRVKTLSGQHIVFSPGEVKKICSAQNVLSRHERFIPIIQVETDIPCAECGATLMPHSVKQRVIEDLDKCKTPYDYYEVLNKYEKYHGHYSRKLIEIFNGIVEQNPYITCDKFVEKFEYFVGSYLRTGLYRILADYKRSKGYYEQKLDEEKLAIFNKVYYRTQRYIDKGNFDDFNINKYNEAVLGDITLTDYNIKAISSLLRQFRIITYKHDLVIPPSTLSTSSQNKINSAVFRLLMSDLATADHLVALDKGGEGSKYNLIGLCKGCNKLKSNKSVVAWYDQHPGVKRNLPNHIAVIADMANCGELDGYEDWAEKISDTLYTETKGLLDLRDKYIY